MSWRAVKGNRGISLKSLVIVLMSAFFMTTVAGTGHADLPGPTWMPGFPLVAGTQVILMWSPVPGATKYLVFQNDKQVAESVAFQHIAMLPTEGSHVFYVVAVDAAGKPGAKSKEFRYEIQKLEKPKNLVTLPGEGRVVLRWDPVKGAIIYDVQRGEKKEGPFVLAASTQEVFYTDTTVKPGKSYYYKVSAKNAAGVESGYSDPFMVAIEEAKAVEAAKAQEAKKVLPIVTKPAWEATEVPEGADVLIFPDRKVAMSTAYPGASSVILFDETGKQLWTASPPPGSEKTVTFMGLGFSKDGDIWAVSSTSPDIFLIGKDGQILKRYTLAPLKETRTPYFLFDVVEGPDGKLYVSEQGNGIILVVEEGKIVSSFGSKGWKDGQLGSPMFTTLVKDELVIGDGGNNRLSVFGLDGKFRRNFGARGGAEAGTFMRLAGIASDEEGKIYAADRVTNNMQVFETSGAFYGALSNEQGTGQAKTAPVGIFVRNKEIAISVPLAAKLQLFKILGPKQPVEPKK